MRYVYTIEFYLAMMKNEVISHTQEGGAHRKRKERQEGRRRGGREKEERERRKRRNRQIDARHYSFVHIRVKANYHGL